MSAGAWSERRWWWLPLLLLLLVNIAVLAWYGTVYSGYAKSVDRQLENRRSELERLEEQSKKQRQTLQRLDRNQTQLTRFYTERLAPPSERLTDVIREVRSLAKTAGLQPSSINYPEDELADYGLVKRTFSFNVEGSYAQLRRFINLLEMTESFLTLEAVTMGGRKEDARLRIRLKLSTLFTQEPAPDAGGEVAS